MTSGRVWTLPKVTVQKLVNQKINNMPHTRCEGSFLSMFQYCYRYDHTAAALMAPGSPLLSPKKTNKKKVTELDGRWQIIILKRRLYSLLQMDRYIFGGQTELAPGKFRLVNIPVKARAAKWRFTKNRVHFPEEKIRRFIKVIIVGQQLCTALPPALSAASFRNKEKNHLSISQLAKCRFTFNVRNNNKQKKHKG